jgi:hypothetical protein
VGIPQRIIVAISGLLFAGVAALTLGVTLPAAAATLAAPTSTQSLTALPTCAVFDDDWDDDWDDGDWDDDWDDDWC